MRRLFCRIYVTYLERDILLRGTAAHRPPRGLGLPQLGLTIQHVDSQFSCERVLVRARLETNELGLTIHHAQ